MNKIIIETSSEVGHNVIVHHLKARGIEFTERFLSDSSFPSINNSRYGEIRIYTAEEGAIMAILADIPDEYYKLNIQERKSNRNLIRIGLITYSIVISLLFVKYWYRDYNAANQKNFSIEWDYSNASITYTYKKTGERAFRYFDSNYDLNFEKSFSYAYDNVVSEYYDSDENGYYEEAYHYDFAGDLIGYTRDNNSDGFYDYHYMVTDENDTLIFEDNNRNGRYEWINKEEF